jgi:hypothetical protein
VPAVLEPSPSPRSAPSWKRLRSGLGLACAGGFVLLLAVILLALTIAAIALIRGPGFFDLSDEAETPKLLLSLLGQCGFMLTSLVGVSLAAIGGFLALSVPAETGARGWLSGSLACLVVGGLALAVAFIGLIALASRVDAAPAGGSLLRFVAAAGLVGSLLVLLSFLAYGRFLVRLALHLGEGSLALSASNYATLLAVCALSAPLLTCLVSFLASDEGVASLTLRLGALVLAGMFLGWWLSLVSRVRQRLPR